MVRITTISGVRGPPRLTWIKETFVTTRFIPLRGHPYHDKTEAELRYIIKDAGEAARAMRGHAPEAECKYLDQVNDACTILAYRERALKKG